MKTKTKAKISLPFKKNRMKEVSRKYNITENKKLHHI
jgi:hypothetical protein